MLRTLEAEGQQTAMIYGRTCLLLGRQRSARKENEVALELLLRARQIHEEREQNSDAVNEIDENIIDCLYALRRYEEAGQRAERSLQFALSFYYRMSEEKFCRAHLNLAKCLQKLGELQRAVGCLR